MKYKNGVLYVALSAVIFGFIPVLSKEAQAVGVNAVTMTFLRMVIALPVMLFVLIGRKTKLAVSAGECVRLALLGTFGMAGTMATLNAAYGFIDVGAASAIHFVYPIIVFIWCVLRGERKGLSEWCALFVVMCGILLSSDGLKSKPVGLGIAYALLSGVFYAFYVIYSEKCAAEDDFFKVSFYVCLFAGAAAFVYGKLGGGLDLSFGERGMTIAVLVSVLSSLCAVPLFQAGVSRIGASKAGIISAAEPVTSLLFGYALLGEEINAVKIAGGAVLVCGLIMAEKKK